MIHKVASQIRRLAIAILLFVTLWSGFNTATMAEVPSQVMRLQLQVDTLEDYVANKDWLEIRSYIHGPMGQVRRQLFVIAQKLPESTRASIEDDIENVSKNLNIMDEAAQNYNENRIATAQKALNESVRNIAAAF